MNLLILEQLADEYKKALQSKIPGVDHSCRHEGRRDWDLSKMILFFFENFR
jgi:hypothetical protein